MREELDEQGLLDSGNSGADAFVSASLWVALAAGAVFLIIALYAAVQGMATVALWLAVVGVVWSAAVGAAIRFRKRR
ncbi:hypothetical protein ACF081_09615 [Streptomyces longwoodensis]|uniref:hypothetical protein n=1 Tax=Streptomyces longwoodensis TaxID=68231 RepID=UPI0037010E57